MFGGCGVFDSESINMAEFSGNAESPPQGQTTARFGTHNGGDLHLRTRSVLEQARLSGAVVTNRHSAPIDYK